MLSLLIRIYSEPDIDWWLKERDLDLTGVNSKAELIVTSNKGFRKPQNIRHPHSWSIVDNEELLGWLLGQK